MESIFVSYSFDPRGRELAQLVKDLIRTYDIRSTDGESLGGGPLNDSIRKLIKESDGLIAVLTAVDDEAPSDYVRQELAHARSIGRRAISLVDQDVDLSDNLWSEFERVELAAGERAAYLKLSRTIGSWRRESGRLVQVAIAPSELARLVESDGGVCKCRLTRRGEVIQDWKEVPLLPEAGGVAAYLSGVIEEAMVQLRIDVRGQRWESRALPQWIHAELQRKGD